MSSTAVANLSLQFISVAQSCPTLCNPMNHSMPGLPVHHQLLEFTETHVHRVSDAIQPSHHREPLVEVGNAPGARQGRGDPRRRGSVFRSGGGGGW